MTKHRGFAKRMRVMASNARNVLRYRDPALIARAAGQLRAPASDEAHLRATLAWLTRAHDACDGRGVSISFGPRGWHADPYPETSGYIIETFLAASSLLGDRTLFDRAVALGAWEIEILDPSGGVLSSIRHSHTRVFNTGQVIHGWLTLYAATAEQRFLDAAQRAGRFLVERQEPDGAWRRHTYCGARTYHGRVAWALVELARVSGDDTFSTCATRNLRWVLAQQTANGWFASCGFDDDDPNTHVLGYTLEGLVGAQRSLARSTRDAPLAAALGGAAAALASRLVDAALVPGVCGVTGLLPGSFDELWRGDASSSCLTGDAQIAFALFQLGHARAAGVILDAVKCTQQLDSTSDGVRGGVAGSHPFGSGYLAAHFPNWGAKFFCDALMFRMRGASPVWLPLDP